MIVISDEFDNPQRALTYANVSTVDKATCQQVHEKYGFNMYPEIICIDDVARICKVKYSASFPHSSCRPTYNRLVSYLPTHNRRCCGKALQHILYSLSACIVDIQ